MTDFYDRIWASHLQEDHPGHPFEGWWHCDEAAAQGVPFIREDIHNTLLTERHADAEYIAKLEAELAELRACFQSPCGERLTLREKIADWISGGAITFFAKGWRRSAALRSAQPPEDGQ